MNVLCDKCDATVVLLPAAVREEFPGTRGSRWVTRGCRFLGSVLIATLAILLMQAAAFAAIQIPAFTPNIVDPQGYLDSEARQRVDTQLQNIRDQSGIWGAVYVLDTLDGQSIEDLAEKAFKKWELGKAGQDNGLLLVLVMKDRESRFEVGYGLEGSITDVHARRALDDYLAPRMRAGDPAGAIVDAFDYLSLQVMHPDAVAAGLMDEPSGSEASPEWMASLPSRLAQAFAVLIAFALGMLAVQPLDGWWRRRCIAKLLRADPSFRPELEKLVTDTPSEKKKDSLGTMIVALLFLASFPAAFAFAVISDYPQTFWVFLAAPPVLLVVFAYAANRQYISLTSYRQHLDRLAEERRQLIEKGHMEEASPGVYKYTAAYHEANRVAAASRRSSSSSGSSSRSSSRSSSGGGRSGGGGSSSKW